jgi:hypothetical protein
MIVFPVSIWTQDESSDKPVINSDEPAKMRYALLFWITIRFVNCFSE